MLPKGDHVRAALLDSGALAVTAPAALVIDSSTIATAQAVDIAAAVAATGRRFLDAPVSGGTAGAANATLTFMVGGAEADLDEARPLLQAMGTRVFHAGDLGAGQSAKMLNNMMLAANMQSTCEAAALAQRLGIPPKTVIEIAGVSTGDSWALRSYYPVGGAVESAPSSRDFTGGFAVTLMQGSRPRARRGGLARDRRLGNRGGRPTTGPARRQTVFGGLDFSALIRLVDGTIEIERAREGVR